MTDDDSKKIDGLKELLEIIKHKVDLSEINRTNQGASIQLMRDQLSVMNKKLDDLGKKLDDPDTGLKRLNERVDASTAATVELESTIKGYADSYQANDTNIRKAEQRLETLEEKARVDIPPELHFTPQSDL